MKDKKRPLVSIIIPVYNGANFVKYAIESAINQTYKNIEIIVVNDGSNDDGKTEKEILKYKKYIKYIKKENGGVSTALNLAIDNMKGDYFSWLSHDDEYELDKIEKQINYLETNNLIGSKTILYSDYKLIDVKGNTISECFKDSYQLNKKPLYSILRGAINGLTLLIPKEAFNDCGKFDINKKCTQDYELWWKMLKKYKFIHQQIYTAKTRVHSNQVTNTSPKVITEGNEMWLSFFNDMSEDEKTNLEGSVYSFYKRMADFLNDTVYEEARNYCINKCEEISSNFKMSNDLVSVIIPTFNREKVTISAIKSVLNQTYDNYEIIVVDDCSNSTKDIEQFIKPYKNIKLIKQNKNHGAAAARNLGIKSSNGKYIAFLDSDDQYVKDKIYKQLKEMQLFNAKISHTSYIKNDLETNKQELMSSGNVDGTVLGRLIYSCGIATPTVMIEKDFLVKNKLFFNENLVIGEDTCYWLEILKNCDLLGINEYLTIVNTCSSSAAYNYEKMVTGYKTIIKYVINDKMLSCFDKEIALLMRDYSNLIMGNSHVDYYKNLYENLLNSKSMILTRPFRLMANKMRVVWKKIK